MTTKLPKTDVVCIGFGWTGAIMAQELTDAGLNVMALSSAANGATPPTTSPPRWPRTSCVLLAPRPVPEAEPRHHHHPQQRQPRRPCPCAKLGSFLLGSGVGGAGVHWNGQVWRFLPSDLQAKSHNTERYGASALQADMTIQDYGVTYAELEPYYDKFEYLCGVSGKAGNLNGAIQPGGDVFEGPRSREYPNPPLDMPFGPMLFAKAAADQGRHPFPHPAANMSRAYTNPLGVRLGPCTYCGFCEKYGCGNYSKASAQTTILPVLMKKPNFTLKTESEVLKINLAADGKTATGVTYIDAAGQTFEQPADMVVLSSYITNNVRMLLLSGIGKPYDPNTGEGRGGQELRLPDHLLGECLLRQADPEPVRGRGRARHDHQRFQRRQLRPHGSRLHRRRLCGHACRPARGPSRPT